jgi:hypothetical protein
VIVPVFKGAYTGRQAGETHARLGFPGHIYPQKGLERASSKTKPAFTLMSVDISSQGARGHGGIEPHLRGGNNLGPTSIVRKKVS